MSKQRKVSPAKSQARTETSLPLSIIIPLADDPDKLNLYLESLQKIRKPFAKDFEVILTVRQEAQANKMVAGTPGGEALLEKGNFKIVSLRGEVSREEAIKVGLKECSRDNILVCEPDTLERSFNFDELFSIPEEELFKKNIILPLFRGQELRPGKDHSPFLLVRKSLARYVFDLDSPGGGDYQSALFYRLAKLELEAGLHPISQVNPFASPQQINNQFPGAISGRFRNFIDWYFRIPLREIKTYPHREFHFLKLPSYFRSLFVITAFLIAIILPILSLDAGQSGDDVKHYLHAEKVYNYFATRGEDKSALNDPRLKLNYYGQSFDLLTYLVNKTFKIEKEYEARHFLNALTGFLCILFAGLLATRLSGFRAGFLTMVMMFFAPRFLGHSLNNPMDVPFALGYVFTLYHSFRLFQKLPKFSNKNAFWIMIGIAFTISIRIGGLLLIPYVFMFAGLYVLITRFEFKLFSAQWFSMVMKGLMYLAVISLAGYLVSLIPWPYGFQKPFKNPFEALRMMSNISVSIKVLFDGAIHWSNKLPWYYISMNILYTVPVILLSGFLLSALLFPFYKKNIKPVFIFFLFFVVVFPIAYIVYKESNVYGGWRHLLFVFPAMAILSGIAWDQLIRLLNHRALKYAIAVILLGGIIHPLVHIVRNHPLEYIYFNELLGVKKAYGRFETDYYMNSLKPGADWLAENVLKNKDPQAEGSIRVATNGSVNYYLRDLGDRVKPFYTRYYDRGQMDWDYAVYFCNYIDPFQLKNGLWPPAGTIGTIDVNGIPVCAIVERESKEDMEAIQLIQQRDFLNGIPMLEEVNRKYPNNEIVKLRLAEAYLQTGQFEKVHDVIEECLQIYPDYDKALNLKGVAYMESGDLEKAKSTFLLITRINYRFASAFHNLGLLYMRSQPPDVATSINYFQRAIQTNRNYRPSYVALGAIYRQQGRLEEAQRYENIANSL
ncbi:tetratricopeptide repeat protein [Bacteroidota bacterium]